MFGFCENIFPLKFLKLLVIYLIGDVIDDNMTDEELKIRFHISNKYFLFYEFVISGITK